MWLYARSALTDFSTNLILLTSSLQWLQASLRHLHFCQRHALLNPGDWVVMSVHRCNHRNTINLLHDHVLRRWRFPQNSVSKMLFSGVVIKACDADSGDLTLASNVYNAASRSSFWTDNGLNELPGLQKSEAWNHSIQVQWLWNPLDSSFICFC